MPHLRSRRASRLALIAALSAGALTALPTGAAARSADACPDDRAKVSGWSYDITRTNGTKVNNVSRLAGNVKPGDRIVASFKLAPGCSDKLVTLASYRALSADGTPLEAQKLFDHQTKSFTNTGGSPRLFENALRVSVFRATGGTSTGGDASQCQDQTPNPDDGNGANTSGPYDPTCDGSPSQNGSGNGAATGRPCAGCVGNADAKNPPGQRPDGSDNNAGYECDRNNGIGQTNPAHTGCKDLPYYQVDFATGGVIKNLSLSNLYGPKLIDFANGPTVD